MNREDIYSLITAERIYQDEKWGTEFDALNTPNDWVAFIARFLGKAITLPWNQSLFRLAILKVAALCVAVLERDSFADRHYDKGETRPSLGN